MSEFISMLSDPTWLGLSTQRNKERDKLINAFWWVEERENQTGFLSIGHQKVSIRRKTLIEK